MKKKDAIKYSRCWFAACAFAAACALLLMVGSQYMILTSHGLSPLSKLSIVEGVSITDAEQELAAGTGRDKVYDIHLEAQGAAGDMVRIYIDNHLMDTLSGGKGTHIALETGQRLAVDGELLLEPLMIRLTVEGDHQLPEVTIEPGALQELPWEK